MFSEKTVWHGYKETQIIEDLKKFYVPKIFSDVPHQTWGIICECLNPFHETRIDAEELLERYVKLMMKMKIKSLERELLKYSKEVDLNVSRIEQSGDPKAIRRCPLHPKLEGKIIYLHSIFILCTML